MKVGDKQVDLQIWDTAGQEDYDRLRLLSYTKVHVVLIAFSIAYRYSFENVEEKWVPEVLQFCSNPPIPYLLIGCQKDLRLDPHTIEEAEKTREPLVSFEEGEELAKKIGAVLYLECSGRTGEGVTKVFEEAAAASLLTRDKPKKPRKCVVV